MNIQSHQNKVRSGLVAALLFAAALQAAPVSARVIKVLTISGDWKSQAWYQDVWMGGKQLYRGRYIASKVNAAAPGQFEFTDVTNYIGQQYLDSNYLSQFDVLLLADTNGWSMPPRFLSAIHDFVQNGGGFIYCASFKWHTCMLNGSPMEAALPASWLPGNDTTDDWQLEVRETPDTHFKPIPVDASHPVMQGLDWADAPPLDLSYKIKVKEGADVLLKGPSGWPILAAWSFGKGRSIMSSSIFANDEASPQFGQDWSDFGKFYAQVFRWLGANSPRRDVTFHPQTATYNLSIDYTRPLNPIPPGIFSIHAAHDDPGLAPLSGLALQNFLALHPEGGFSRMAVDCEPKQGQFDFTSVDSQLAEIRRLNLHPIALFGGPIYGSPKWMWSDSTWSDPSPAAISAFCDEVSGFLSHTNHGKGGDAGYDPAVQYVEIGNEPGINGKTIDGYCKLFRAVAERVHRDYPGVKVGGLGGYEIPYVYWFIDRCGSYIDWISRHPYGWTGEMLFKDEDDYEAYARKKGYNQIKFIVTEWDYWIQGRPKFDYMMRRYFEAVKRPDLLGTLHYRLGQYSEPIYLFGVLWVGWGQDKGAGAKGTPMHDAYDALWLWRDFRGERVASTETASTGEPPRLIDSLQADASRNGEKLNAVLYYDWGTGGPGYADDASGIDYAKASVQLHLHFPPSAKDRTLTISHATGEGFETEADVLRVPAGQADLTHTVEMEPVTGLSITVE